MQQASWRRQSFGFAFFFFAYYGYIGVFSPYASLYFADRGIAPAEIGVLMSMMQVMRIFGPNMWGWVADRSRDRVAVLRLTALLALTMFSGMFFSRTFGEFLAVMVLLNLFTSAQGPLSEALMLSAMRGDLTHYGRIRLWGSVGFIAATTVAGELLDRRGIDWMPWSAGFMLALVLAASLPMRDAPPAGPARPLPSTASLLKDRAVVAFFASAFLMIAAHAALYAFYSLHLARLGYSKSVIGAMWSLGVVAEIVFFYVQAPIIPRFGVPRLLIGSFLLAAGRFLLIGYGAASLVLLLVAQVLHAASFGVHHSCSVAAMQRWFGGPLQARGQALYISIAYGIGGTLGGLAMSVLWETSGAAVVYAMAASLSLAGAVAAALSFRWQTRENAP
ncbi:MAG: MFS transporter [Burkholderiaceae bacterium]